MPTTMPHASIGETLDVMQKQDMALETIPEVDLAVGKLGRVESPLDPAPISMFETIINYKPEYLVDRSGHRRRYQFDAGQIDYVRDRDGNRLAAPDGLPYKAQGKYARDDKGELIPDPDGQPFRLWRPALDPDLNPGRKSWGGIQKPDDIWDLIVSVTSIPGTTSAPKLQPIAARIVMLQSGMRAPMGVKVKGPDLDSIEQVGLQIEKYLKEVPSVQSDAVVADRIVGKPYLDIDIDR
jgi:Cu(I)/Ag(I) efflux system membrane protein CusA/SilA